MTDSGPDWVYDAQSGALYGPSPGRRNRVVVATGVSTAWGQKIADAMNQTETVFPTFEAFRAELDFRLDKIPGVARALYMTDGTTDVILREDLRQDRAFAEALQELLAHEGFPGRVTTIIGKESETYEIRMEDTPR